MEYALYGTLKYLFITFFYFFIIIGLKSIALNNSIKTIIMMIIIIKNNAIKYQFYCYYGILFIAIFYSSLD